MYVFQFGMSKLGRNIGQTSIQKQTTNIGIEKASDGRGVVRVVAEAWQRSGESTLEGERRVVRRMANPKPRQPRGLVGCPIKNLCS